MNGNLTEHEQSMHQGIKYNCEECGYQASTKSHLTRHKKSIHEEMKYNCNSCDYQAKRKSHLTTLSRLGTAQPHLF